MPLLAKRYLRNQGLEMGCKKYESCERNGDCASEKDKRKEGDLEIENAVLRVGDHHDGEALATLS